MTNFDYRITVDVDTTELGTGPDGGQLTELLEAVRSAVEEFGLGEDQFDVAGDDPAGGEELAEWLIWSHEHGYWWAPTSSGYRDNVADAGRYTFEQAEDACSLRSWLAWDRPPEVMVLAPPADLLGTAHLDKVMRARVEAATAEAVALRGIRSRAVSRG